MTSIPKAFWGAVGSDLFKPLRYLYLFAALFMAFMMYIDARILGSFEFWAISLRIISILWFALLFILSFEAKKWFIENYQTTLIISLILVSAILTIVGAAGGGFKNLYFLGIIQSEFFTIGIFPFKRRRAILSILFINLLYFAGNLYYIGDSQEPWVYHSLYNQSAFLFLSLISHEILLRNRLSNYNTLTEETKERERKEYALLESEQKFMDIFYSTEDASLLLDGNKFIDCNQSTVKMLRANSREDVLKRTPAEHSPEFQPDGRFSFEKSLEMINIALERGFHRFEWVHKRFDGDEFPAEVSLITIPLHGKRVIYTIWRDLSKQKTVEEKYRASEEKSKAFLSAITDIALIIDRFGIILTHNKALAESLGDKDKKFIGMNLFEQFDPDIAETRRRKYSTVFKSGKPVVYEDSRKGRYFLTSIYPVFDSQNKIENLAIYSKDVTEEKQREQELIRYREHLEQLVQERTKELQEANEELYETNAEKDKFFSIIAHDLKNPLSSFRNVTDYLHDNISDLSEEEFREFIIELNSTAKHVFDLLENLLEWARSQTGKLEYNPQNIDLSYVAKTNIELLKLNAIKKNIELTSDIPHNSYVLADSNMVTTVIRNLVSNAIKFTPESLHGSKKSIHVFSRDIGDKYEIHVKDNGVGIKEENIGKLFRIDVHHSTNGTSNEKGTGLGLILCKEFVEMHGGEIFVDSEYGKGSDFFFTLPKPKLNQQENQVETEDQ